jgi:8-oxo-dGTP pyrophosphatase MutT (NUDIX family)
VWLAGALASRTRDTFHRDELRRAAVLVPIVRRDGEVRLVFTLRSTQLKHHSGQVSFPGGRVEEGETAPAVTALREAEEEVGIDPSTVRVLGMLGDIPTPTGYTITPVVGFVEPPPASYRPQVAEVAAVFEVGLARLAAPGARVPLGRQERWGRMFELASYNLDGYNIWGATAYMVDELLRILLERSG